MASSALIWNFWLYANHQTWVNHYHPIMTLIHFLFLFARVGLAFLLALDPLAFLTQPSLHLLFVRQLMSWIVYQLRSLSSYLQVVSLYLLSIYLIQIQDSFRLRFFSFLVQNLSWIVFDLRVDSFMRCEDTPLEHLAQSSIWLRSCVLAQSLVELKLSVQLSG